MEARLEAKKRRMKLKRSGLLDESGNFTQSKMPQSTRHSTQLRGNLFKAQSHDLDSSDPYAPSGGMLGISSTFQRQSTIKNQPGSTRNSNYVKQRGFIPIVAEDELSNELNDISGIANDMSMNIDEASVDIDILRRMNNTSNIKDRSNIMGNNSGDMPSTSP